MSAAASGSLTRKALSGGAGSVLSKLGGIVLSVGFMAVLARLIGPQDYGLFAYMTLLIGIAQVLPTAMAQALTSHGTGPAGALPRSHAWLAFGLALVSAPLMAWLWGWLASRAALAAPWRLPLEMAVGLAVACSCICTVSEGLLGRMHRFGWISSSEFVSQALVANLGTLVAAWWWPDVRALVCGGLAAALVRLVIQGVGLARSGLALAPAGEGEHRPATLLPFAAVQGANYVGRNGDNWVVGACLGAVELGVYSRAYNLMSKPMLALSAFVMSVFYPLMASARDDDAKFRNGYVKATVVISVLGLSAAGYLVVMATEIVGVVLGERWQSVAPAFAALSFGAYFRIAYRVTESVSLVRGSATGNMLRQSLYAVAVLLAAALGAAGGAQGVALGVSLALAGFYVVSLAAANAAARLGWMDWARLVMPAAGITLGACLLTWAVSPWQPDRQLWHFISGSLFYWAAVAVLWALMLTRLSRHETSATLRSLAGRLKSS